MEIRVPRFENTWSFGNTLTIVAMVLGGIGVYTNFTASLRVQEQVIAQLREQIEMVQQTTAQYEVRTRALELNSGRIEEKLLAINASLQRIEAKLSESKSR